MNKSERIYLIIASLVIACASIMVGFTYAYLTDQRTYTVHNWQITDTQTAQISKSEHELMKQNDVDNTCIFPNRDGKYYVFNQNLDSKMTQNLKQAERIWHEKAGIEYVNINCPEKAQIIVKAKKHFSDKESLVIGSTITNVNKELPIAEKGTIELNQDAPRNTSWTNTLLHEFGHSLGLKHVVSDKDIMNACAKKGQTVSKLDAIRVKIIHQKLVKIRQNAKKY